VKVSRASNPSLGDLGGKCVSPKCKFLKQVETFLPQNSYDCFGKHSAVSCQPSAVTQIKRYRSVATGQSLPVLFKS
ncbi:hypothetical protein, partial [Moorena sp. SIO2C4]|uniref:hypothetical protein n=1 Tax=Moorena sp. SIO2C4 TaxID=2607824 RepID=UPI00257AEF79